MALFPCHMIFVYAWRQLILCLLRQEFVETVFPQDHHACGPSRSDSKLEHLSRTIWMTGVSHVALAATSEQWRCEL
eukprot:2036575-Amphidinium_carterae.2